MSGNRVMRLPLCISDLLKNAPQYGIIKAQEGGDCMAETQDKRSENSGRKYDQKMKPFLVYQYLMRETDEEHFVSAQDIVEYLQENFEISAERRSIYRDINEINKALLAIDEGVSLEQAEELLYEDEEYKTIRHHKRKGFYVSQRNYEQDDIRLLAECVHAAKFVDTKRAERLARVVFNLVSVHQAENMNHKAIVKDRVKTSNTSVYYTVSNIHEAISKGGRFTRKVSFQYLKYTLQDLTTYSERRQGVEYVVTPYSLVIDNGNYYLLGYDHGKEQIRTYRVDRIKNLKILDDFNSDPDMFKDIEIERYTQGHFGMFGGRLERVTLNCSIHMLDTMVDRFGTENVLYSKGFKDGFFNVRVPVYISELFFGWLAGFGKQVKIVEPISVKKEYTEYLKSLYQWQKD